MISSAELGVLLAARPPDAVFVYRSNAIVQPFIDYAQTRGYRLADAMDRTYEIWVRPTPAALGHEFETTRSLLPDAERR